MARPLAEINRRERLRGRLKRRGYELCSNKMLLYLPPEAQNGGFMIKDRRGNVVLGGKDFDADLDAVEIFVAELDQ